MAPRSPAKIRVAQRMWGVWAPDVLATIESGPELIAEARNACPDMVAGQIAAIEWMAITAETVERRLGVHAQSNLRDAIVQLDRLNSALCDALRGRPDLPPPEWAAKIR